MRNWISEQKALADRILAPRLAASQEAFRARIATSDAEFQRTNTYGGGGWYGSRDRLGREELANRAEIIRGCWREVLAGQSARRATKLRAVAAETAAASFQQELDAIVNAAVPRAGTLYPAGNPRVIVDSAELVSSGLSASLLIPPGSPDKGWIEKQFEDLASKVLVWIVGILVGLSLPRIAIAWQMLLDVASKW